MTANAGYHAFSTGDVLTAAQVQYNLQNQTIMYFASSAARTTALSGVLVEGMFSYLADTDSTEYYNGSAWTSISNPGDITAVTAGTGISGGGTSGAVTVTNSMATAITTNGDIIYGTGSGTFSRLGIGSSAQVLTVSGGVPSWATPAGGSTFVGARAKATTTQTISHNSSATVLFNAETYDTDGFHSTTTNTSRMTIPSGKAGYYLIHGLLCYPDNATGAREIVFTINGT